MEGRPENLLTIYPEKKSGKNEAEIGRDQMEAIFVEYFFLPCLRNYQFSIFNVKFTQKKLISPRL